MSADYPVLLFTDQAAWRAWLDTHHATTQGVWLQLAKKASALTSVSYAEALDAALCYGWIDGQKKARDADSWLQKFTPRGPRSIWSKKNRDAAEALIKRRRMKPAGVAAVKSAQRDGRWERAYEGQSSAAVPADLQAALDAHPEAKAFFATIKSHNRYAILFRIQTAKRAETRARRIEQFIAMLERHETVHP
ncbi:MAG TPA: YdeI/OmpD-associated family protein [Gemmatimonadaceae bacterium]|nr:YdeI/OmpD-associated family protein [Gemmatimonadaceae bacterium]